MKKEKNLPELLKLHITNVINNCSNTTKKKLITEIENMDNNKIINNLPLGMLDLLKIEKC